MGKELTAEAKAEKVRNSEITSASCSFPSNPALIADFCSISGPGKIPLFPTHEG